jgi:uncharacterized protein with GYD domain
MTVYATLVKFSAQEVTNMTNTKKALEEARKAEADLGVRPIGAYATLGPYDIMLIYEGKDEKAAVGISMSFGARGGRTETWTLIPVEEMEKPDKPGR